MRIALAYTGGTIGSVGQPLDPMPSQQFRDWWTRKVVPSLPEAAAAFWIDFGPSLDSSQAEPADWVRLARTVLNAAEIGADAVVLLHGTDTLANSAAALGYLTTLLDAAGTPVGRLGIPVVLTGAQRPLFDDDGSIRAGTDAFGNVRDAISRLAGLEPGVHVVFAGGTFPGPRILKVSTLDDNAFMCPNGPGALASLPAADPAALISQLDDLEPEIGRRAVISIGPSPNPPSTLAAGLAGVLTALGEQLGAILLLGYGTGNIPAPRQVAPQLRAARARGMMIAIGTQVPAGAVAPGVYGSGSWLAEVGALPTGDMTMPAAQAKLHLTLALKAKRKWSGQQAGAFFTRPVAGEIAVAM